MTFMLQANLVFLEFLKVEFEAKLQLSGPSAAEPAPILELVDSIVKISLQTFSHSGSGDPEPSGSCCCRLRLLAD